MADENPQEKPQTSAQKRILLVDDDREIVESMKIALEAAGYGVVVARDGNQGLAMVERENPDLVILDMMMPKRSGFLVLEKLRRTRPVPIRIIMVTANEGSRHKAYAEMLGVDDYIRKPFAMDRLMDSVQRLLGYGSGHGRVRPLGVAAGNVLVASSMVNPLTRRGFSWAIGVAPSDKFCDTPPGKSRTDRPFAIYYPFYRICSSHECRPIS